VFEQYYAAAVAAPAALPLGTLLLVFEQHSAATVVAPAALPLVSSTKGGEFTYVFIAQRLLFIKYCNSSLPRYRNSLPRSRLAFYS